MKIKPIENIKDICTEYGLINIKSENPKIYTRLVFLFDKDDFLDDVKKIRKEITSENFVYLDADDVDQFIFEDMFEDGAYPNLPKHLQDGKVQRICHKAMKLCKPLAAKYHRTSNYDLAILYAVLCNQVDSDSLATGPSFKYLSSEYKHSGVPEMTMVFYPETSIQDVRKIFDRMKKTMTKSYFEEVWNTEEIKFDTISRIERDREIYWYKKMGYSWTQIIEKINEDFGDFLDIKSVSQSNNQYKKGLNNH